MDAPRLPARLEDDFGRAVTAVWLATLPEGRPTGGSFKDRRPIALVADPRATDKLTRRRQAVEGLADRGLAPPLNGPRPAPSTARPDP